MKTCLRSGATWLLLLLATITAAAQGTASWAPVYQTSGGYYHYIAELQLPTASSVWALHHDENGMGIFGVRIYASSDGGLNWQNWNASGRRPHSISIPVSGTDVTDLWALDGQQAWAVMMQYTSNSRELQHTTTGPAGFAAAPAQVPNPAQVRFFSISTGIVLTTDAATPLFRTTDGGQSWQSVAGAPSLLATYGTGFALENVLYTSAKSSVVLGSHAWLLVADKLLHTADAGLTWSTSTTPAVFSDITFRDGLHGLAYGPMNTAQTDKVLYSTSDGGATWNVQNRAGLARLGKILAMPNLPGTYISSGPLGGPLGSAPVSPTNPRGTAISYNDGQTWLELDNTWSSDILFVSPTNRIWSASTPPNSTNFFRLDGIVLATKQMQANAPEAYPNPTTGIIRLPVAGPHQQVAVYDVAGRHCRTVALSPAETSLDLSTLADGLYLLRLSGGTALPQTQRIALVR